MKDLDLKPEHIEDKDILISLGKRIRWFKLYLKYKFGNSGGSKIHVTAADIETLLQDKLQPFG